MKQKVGIVQLNYFAELLKQSNSQLESYHLM